VGNPAGVNGRTITGMTDCDRICDQATLDIAEKRPIQIGFERRQAVQVIDLI
jgi:hypothetical protein